MNDPRQVQELLDKAYRIAKAVAQREGIYEAELQAALVNAAMLALLKEQR